MKRESSLHTAVKRSGGIFIRRAKHGALYRLPNGETILVAGSPGDRRSLNNGLADLKRKLGVPQ